ncbi:GNAT family protein [Mangrovivirga sp. M17]|uniref:GNAT family protein n=1 Tax=Mangrovivirga halotolerans TaxID=2993936 RepID=A0ABT3RVF5_9BACT|nr:GNAT family protein [Mangrovivirga halotolerans]MCX2745572.1 GNAT family protein [Mangrovivirga halotolerans]
MEPWLKPVTLEGNLVKLIPLTKDHAEDLVSASTDGELWNLKYATIPSEETVDNYISKALDEKDAGLALPFAIVEKKNNRIIGSTRLYEAQPHNRRISLGYTWYSVSFQRTGVNTECKYLILKHAFEKLDAIAVQFKTDWFNFRSREAILRLGAKQDGVLRNDRINPDGSYRDTVVFSIIESEWPAVKRNLDFKLTAY